MKILLKAKILFAVSLLAVGAKYAVAANPFVQTCFTTDPAPMVYDDTLYVYTGHDEDNASFFEMLEWRVYSTTDMVNWTDHGSPLSLDSFSWADDRAWAPQCVERNGKFYFYVPAHSRLTGAMAIGVAVGDSPTGPFEDAIGKPLVDGNWAYIDPTVFIDDDGQAYLYWGNPDIYYVKLNEDMISYDGDVKVITQTPEAFGNPPANSDSKSSYTEGPWFFKRNGLYYLLYAAGGIPEHIAYSISDGPTGPWKYKGVIMPNVGWLNSFTNHCGIADYKGNSYFFYHSGCLPGGGGFDRSVCVEQFEYDSDGNIPTILPTKKGPVALGTVDPYSRVEAETISWADGVGTRQNNVVGVYVAKIHDGDSFMVSNVDFADEHPVSFEVNVSNKFRDGKIEVHLDSKAGPKVAELDVPRTGGSDSWQLIESKVTEEISGVHDLCFLFSGMSDKELFKMDYWRFRSESSDVRLLEGGHMETPAVVYDMCGVKVLETYDRSRLSTLPKGIYIVDGKKVVL